MPSMSLDAERTAVILIGYQNDYFAPSGVLRSVVEESARVSNILANTVALVQSLSASAIALIATPIQFTPGYSELVAPIGILKAIKDAGAFQAGTFGAETIAELRQYGDRIANLPGNRGLNAFSNTALDHFLRDRGVEDVVLAGAVTSICIDSTGRAAYERGYRVHVLRDCTSARTPFEQDYFFDSIFPLYARTPDSHALLNALGLP